MANTRSDTGAGSIHLGCVEAAAFLAAARDPDIVFLDCRGDPTRPFQYVVDQENYLQMTLNRYTKVRGSRFEPWHKGGVFSYIDQGGGVASLNAR